MPIEFRCTECNGLLRTPDGTSGKQAQCPQCSAVMTIPGDTPSEAGPQDASPDAAVPPYVSEIPTGGTPFGAGPAAAQPLDPNNPYQAPVSYQTVPTSRGADGPAWERERKSPVSFFKTVTEAFGNPARFFGTMRRQGGIGAPLVFSILGGVIGFALYMLIHIPFAILTGMMDNDPNVGPAEMMLGMGCCLFMVPFAQVAFLFLATGIHHLMLNMMAGADHSFEVTFRVVAYSAGCACLTGMIPACGQYIFWIPYLVLTSMGLCYAQQASVGKATAAVLVPAALCGGLAVVALVAMVMAIMPV